MWLGPKQRRWVLSWAATKQLIWFFVRQPHGEMLIIYWTPCMVIMERSPIASWRLIRRIKWRRRCIKDEHDHKDEWNGKWDAWNKDGDDWFHNMHRYHE
jgi:hypothetical protein